MKRFKITFKGQVYELDVEEIGSSITAPEAPKTVSASPTPVPAAKAVPSGAKNVISPMPGKILGMHVKKGDCVKRGDVLCILEAMKMQNEIMANQDGTIAEIQVAVGQNVSTGDVLVIIN